MTFADLHLVAGRITGRETLAKVEIGLAAVALIVGFVALGFAETAAGDTLLVAFIAASVVVWAVQMLHHAGVPSDPDTPHHRDWSVETKPQCRVAPTAMRHWHVWLGAAGRPRAARTENEARPHRDLCAHHGPLAERRQASMARGGAAVQSVSDAAGYPRLVAPNADESRPAAASFGERIGSHE